MTSGPQLTRPHFSWGTFLLCARLPCDALWMSINGSFTIVKQYFKRASRYSTSHLYISQCVTIHQSMCCLYRACFTARTASGFFFAQKKGYSILYVHLRLTTRWDWRYPSTSAYYRQSFNKRERMLFKPAVMSASFGGKRDAYRISFLKPNERMIYS